MPQNVARAYENASALRRICPFARTGVRLRVSGRAQGRAARRWRSASYSSSDAATDTFSEPIAPCIGMRTLPSQRWRTSGRMPEPSEPSTSTTPPVRSSASGVASPSSAAGVAPEVGALAAAQQLGEVRDHRDRQVLDRAGRGLGDDGGHAGGAVPRDHEPVGPEALARARDGTEVARVGDAVERDDERVRAREQLLGVGIRVRVAERDHALVVGPLGERGDAIGDRDRHAHAGGLDPRHRRGRLARAHDLAHAPAAAQGLAHGLQPVDQVGAGRALGALSHRAARPAAPAACRAR